MIYIFLHAKLNVIFNCTCADQLTSELHCKMKNSYPILLVLYTFMVIRVPSFEWVWSSVASAGAHVVQSLAQKLGALLGDKPNYGRGKECDCVVLLLAHLYNYRVCGEGCGRGGAKYVM